MKLEEINYQGQRWINITEPDQDMVNFLRDEFGFHGLDLEDVLSKYQYPKVDAYSEYLFVILQFPVHDKERQIFRRSEVDIFFGKDYLITINSGKLNTLQDFFKACKVDEVARKKFMSRGVALLLYEIVDALFDNVFPIVNKKYDEIFRLEEDVFERNDFHDVIEDIMILKRNTINVHRIIAPQREVLLDLETKYKKFIPEELNIYFDDVIDKIDKLNNQLDTASAYVDVLEDANETLINRSTNRVIKILTIFSVIMLPLTLVTSYYGMNVALPYQRDINVLTYINVVLVVVVIIMLGLFVKKKWL